tara:strand:+ start:5090 stop:8173 length:3084 start_codon:yes stop_codon:yes gene_type:complete
VKQKESLVYEPLILESLLKGSKLSGFDQSSLALFISQNFSEKPAVFLFEDNRIAFDFYETFESFSSLPVFYYPEKSDKAKVPGFISTNERYRQETLFKSIDCKVPLVFSTTSAQERNIEKNQNPKSGFFVIKKGTELDRDSFLSFLVKAGYQKEDSVFTPNSFSVRGDIVDVFPAYFQNPFRCSFDFDVVGRLSYFDPSSQTSTQKTQHIVLRASGSQTTVFINLIEHLSSPSSFFVQLESGLFSVTKNKVFSSSVDLGVVSVFASGKNKEERTKSLVSVVGSLKPKRVFFSGNKKRRSLGLGQVVCVLPPVCGFSFYIKHNGSFVFSERDINKETQKTDKWVPKNRASPDLLSLQDISEISLGDFIVHKNFGVGIYRGLIVKETELGMQEVINIEYGNNSFVSVSVDNITFVHRHLGSGKNPRVATLGSSRWNLELKKARASVVLVAKELVKLYVKKEQERLFSYKEDQEMELALKNSFPFVETPDQKKAIKDSLLDLLKKKPADRLICGDVGFGKTEVALRLMMRAVSSGRSCVFLCPTTILADQHFITCSERFEPLGVRVDLLSRFKTKKEQTSILNRCLSKQVDILVGTHRVLSDDVILPSLGLLIIDEEHKFGVKHKEKIRSLKSHLDVFTLSATPIPRTLQQSMVGIRDISKIQTPPTTRKPIETSVDYFSWSTIKENIEREIERGGQVYFVQNDIPSLSQTSKKISGFFPSFSVDFIHGQMPSRDLEERVLSFFKGGIDILICTTIIESGLDITNANLIIINNAQNFGLSQLYQMRGRVGRGKKRASCLLLIPKTKLKKHAYQRLKTIEKHTTLGSGYDISIKDLEIRGAGSVFGYKQSGHISSVGFEMYCQLLKEEIDRINNPGSTSGSGVNVTLTKSAYIPETYIKNKKQRIGFYNRLSTAKNKKEHKKIQKELIDRFGPIKKQTKNLVLKFYIETVFRKTSVKQIVISSKSILFVFSDFLPFSSAEKLISSLKYWAKKRGFSYVFGKTRNDELKFNVECFDINYAFNIAKKFSSFFN